MCKVTLTYLVYIKPNKIKKIKIKTLNVRGIFYKCLRCDLLDTKQIPNL